MSEDKKPFIIHESDIVGFQGICGWVKELLGPEFCDISNLNIAFITLDPGKVSEAHYHRQLEEVYYILEGTGEITVNNEQREISKGDIIYVPPKAVHTVLNNGKKPLRLITFSVSLKDRALKRIKNYVS